MKKNGYEGFIATSLVFISIVLLSFTVDRSNPKEDDYLKEQSQYEQPAPTDTVKSKRVRKVKLVKSKKADTDSLDIIVKKVSKNLDEIPEEMEHLIEIAYTTDNDSLVKIIHHTLDAYDDTLFAFDFKMEDFDVDMENFDVQMKDFDIKMKDFDFKMKEHDSLMYNFNFISNNEDAKVMVYQFLDNSDTLHYYYDFSFDKANAMKEAQEALSRINIDSIIAVAKENAEFHKDLELVIKHARELKELQKEEIEKIVEEAMKIADEAAKLDENRKVIIHQEFEEEEENNRNSNSEAEMEEELKKLEESD